MSGEITGRGDPVKTLQLLWSGTAPPKRGPKPKVTLADIVSAAVRIADAEGLDAVSTRRVAEAVGISPMSFYTHVPGKAELLDLMLDAAADIGEKPVFDPVNWRQNIALIARGYREFYLKHPWVFELSTHRPVLGPNTMAAYDTALSAFDGLGLDEVEMDVSLTAVSNYVHGAVRDAARAEMVKKLSGLTDNEWWERVAPALEAVDFTPYPVAGRVGPIVGELYGLGDPERSFNFGLELLLDGFERLIASKGKVDGTAPSA
jgi:AcrR family transcriptional regulator